MSLLSVLTLFKVVVCIYVCLYDDVFRTFASMRKELGKQLMDIAKYMTTAILLSQYLMEQKNGLGMFML